MGTASSGRWAVVTPNDNEDLPGGTTRGIYVGTTGDIRMISEAGDDVTFNNLAAGVEHSLRAVRVMETDTTASQIRALY